MIGVLGATCYAVILAITKNLLGFESVVLGAFTSLFYLLYEIGRKDD